MDSLQNELDIIDDVISTIGSDIHIKKEQFEECLKVKQQVITEHKIQNDKLKDALDNLEVKENELVEIKQRKDEIETQITKINNENFDLKSKIEFLETCCNSLSEESDRLDERISILQKDSLKDYKESIKTNKNKLISSLLENMTGVQWNIALCSDSMASGFVLRSDNIEEFLINENNFPQLWSKLHEGEAFQNLKM